LLASPELTSVKKSSQPRAMTNTDMNNNTAIKAGFHEIDDQLSVSVPEAIKNNPPIIMCSVVSQIPSTLLEDFFINTVPKAQLKAEPNARQMPVIEIWPFKPPRQMTRTPANPKIRPNILKGYIDSPSQIQENNPIKIG